jgi:acetoacetate decarboxylase
VRDQGKLTLRGSPSDPLHTIPVPYVGSFTYSTGTSSWSVQSERRLCTADDYLSFFVFRHCDDMRSLQVASGLDSIPSEDEKDRQGSETRVWMTGKDSK